MQICLIMVHVVIKISTLNQAILSRAFFGLPQNGLNFHEFLVDVVLKFSMEVERFLSYWIVLFVNSYVIRYRNIQFKKLRARLSARLAPMFWANCVLLIQCMES